MHPHAFRATTPHHGHLRSDSERESAFAERGIGRRFRGRTVTARARCAHEGFHSGVGRYSRELGRLRYVIVCDDCLAEVRQVAAVDYRPRFDPDGSAGELAT